MIGRPDILGRRVLLDSEGHYCSIGWLLRCAGVEDYRMRMQHMRLVDSFDGADQILRSRYDLTEEEIGHVMRMNDQEQDDQVRTARFIAWLDARGL